jgi:hypothetical protein
MSIPAVYHFVWIGQTFPYYARLAVESVLTTQPAARVVVHTVGLGRAGDPELEACAGYTRVAVQALDVDELFAAIPEGREIAELYSRCADVEPRARGNLLRYALLYRWGGVYLDCDVLVRGDLSDFLAHQAFVGVEQVWRDNQVWIRDGLTLSVLPSAVRFTTAWLLDRIDARWMGGRRWFDRLTLPLAQRDAAVRPNNAVLGAAPESAFIRQLLQEALKTDPGRPLALGTGLLARVLREHLPGEVENDVYLAPPEAFFAVPPSRSFRLFEGRAPVLPAASVLVHLVASNHRQLLEDISDAPANPSDLTLFAALARQVRAAAARLPRSLVENSGEGSGRVADGVGVAAPGDGAAA